MIESRRRHLGPATPNTGAKPRSRRLLLACFAAAGFLFAPRCAPGSVLGSGLQIVERNYLFANELDAPRLLGSALSYAEARIPEVRIVEADDGAYVMVAGPCRLRLELPPKASVHDLEPLLANAATLVDECTTDRPNGLPPTESLLLNGVLSGLDPYSTVFDAAGKEEHTIQFQGSLAGIGARIGVRKEKLTLLTVYPKSPAATAGLKDGDVVRRIDGASTTNLPVNDAVQRIRGEVGSVVRLEIERGNGSDTLTVPVTRGLVVIPSVEARRLDNGIVYAAISHFSQTTPSDFRAHVAKLVGTGGVRGVIIDLRANSGGSMLGSAAIADMFLDEGILITTSGRNGARVAGLTPEIRATSDTPFRGLSAAVLTSPRTASGSELLAASLRTHDRAILVGERTFGKGTVQKTYGLGPEASLKMTVGHFLPNGFSIPGGGLTPDVELRTYVFADGVVWPPADRGAEELPFWLRTPPWLRPATGTPSAILTYAEQAKPEEEEPFGADDPVVELTSELLSRFGSTSADHTLRAATGWLSERTRQADAKLQQAFQERGVDWRHPGPVASNVTPSFEVSIEPNTGALSADTDSDVVVTVTNTGRAPLYRIHGRLDSKARFLSGRGILLGYLAPGQSHSSTIKVKTPAAIRTSRFPVRVELFDEHGLLTESGPVYVAAAAAARPRLSHRVSIEPSNEPGKLNVKVDVRNIGAGATDDVRAFIEHPDSDALELLTATATTAHLAPGETQSLALQARLMKTPTEPVQVKLLLSEGRFHTFYETRIDLGDAGRVGDWREAPDIRVRQLVTPGDDGSFKLLAEADDDDALATVWCRVDGKKVEYIDMRGEPRRSVQVELPWQPSDTGQHVEIVAVDRDGMRTVYVTDL